MRSTLSRGTAVALLPALAMLVLAGCSGNSDAGSGSSPSTAPTSAPTTVTTPTGTPTGPQTSTPSNSTDPSGNTADVTINVTVANGKVNPSGASINVKAGQTVLVTAVSDAPDEVHVHGYDKELPLTPGKPASVKFVANMKGTFEVETHESNKLVAKLVVS
jgi:ABC-type glycerol-3-phosphate transport system substrate-binding protein